MPIGLIGRKCGMTRVFTEDGKSIPVTVIEVALNTVTHLKSKDKDGYYAVQVTAGSQKANRVTKPEVGHFSKAGVEIGRRLWEFRLADKEECDGFSVGKGISLDILRPKQRVDVVGVTIGKGYAGVVKRHNFHTQDASHGNSLSHRAAGSIGQNQTPGRVFKGKRMAGHMGNVRRTMRNLEVIRVDEVRGCVLIKGSVPGPKGADVIVNITASKVNPKGG
uniref:Large ribosomal subunit protein uL3 n=1 Tax=Candidatus Kentrum sp. MB TaxID=2138164 RepID=A0A451BBX4_9GAMM|nr:MAG: LSU ribosomal protein L3P [Candidatus Kentron sp. MB]VFK32265.1 MAG: LSU ribosomal protein L3P [Candidatus Kentron sp. MB]VFK75779.1 MAG: LSU ribosomal protein L3P [Candidatus Kentron sp. MB]